MILEKLLSKRDIIRLVEIINLCLTCKEEDNLKKIITCLREIAPHDYAIIGLAHFDGTIKAYKSINIDYPKEWIKIYISKRYNLCDPVFITNFVRSGLQRWSDTYKLNIPPKEFLSCAKDFGLINGYTFGARDRHEHKNSLISLSGKSIETRDRTILILNNIMPHLHQALIRISRQQTKQWAILHPNISIRETEVLSWLKEGKSSWDISKILSISERTVNFHVANIMQKLNAMSRTHAVAIAAELDLIDFG